ncbi:MAG: 50S ribosomal protein L4 [Candidatus Omnitrophota bacterium]
MSGKSSTIDVYNQKGKKVDVLELAEEVFDGKINLSLLDQAKDTFLANQRLGLAVTKTRGEVSGGGRKPWRQKGTGRARVGSSRSPLWRGGGIIFGPLKRSYAKKFPQKMKILALKSALNAKLRDKEILVIDKIKIDNFKTKNLYAVLKSLKVNGEKTKLVIEKENTNLRLASRNLSGLGLLNSQQVHAYSVLDCKKLIFTAVSLNLLQTRIKKWIK